MTSKDMFRQSIAPLIDENLPRVWSLLVTIFGDIAQAEGTRLSGSALNAITGVIGVKPEATRVALHRLRKENWISSERLGRQSSYALTARGQALSAEASPRIYAGTELAQELWMVVSQPSQGDTRATLDDVQIIPNVSLQNSPSSEELSVPLSSRTHIPIWMRDKLIANDVFQRSGELKVQLERIPFGAIQAFKNDPLCAVVFRVLIVHAWRRVVLRLPALPDWAFAQGWQGAHCRQLVSLALAECPRPDIRTLEENVATLKAVGAAQ